MVENVSILDNLDWVEGAGRYMLVKCNSIIGQTWCL